ncbi:MAG: hypothetical protein HWD86_07825 [Kangiellaceae bacterium]|nr:hypothetical protein [Kangiellaceae bacterium]
MIADIPADVKSALRWIEDLPVADMGETASKVFHYLYDLNQSPLHPKIRLQILESLQPTCKLLNESLSEVYVHSPLKYSHKLQSASELVHALASEQVFGFNAVIEDLAGDPQLAEKYHKTIFPAACANAIHGQGLIQLQRYQLYKSIGSKLWRQQNIIYKLAEQHGFLDQKLKKGTSDLGSIKKQLLINLALSLTNPYQMKHGQANDAYAALLELADFVELTTSINSQTLFAYTPDSEIPPQPSNAIDQKAHKWFGIDLSKVIEMLEKSMMQSGGGFLSMFKKTVEIELDDELKNHILTNWNTIKTRNFIRVNSDQSTQVAIGMAASHHFLIEKHGEQLHERFYGKKKPAFQSKLEESSLQLQHEDDSQHSFVWNQKGSSMGGIGGIGQSKTNDDAFASIYKPRSYDEKKKQKEDHPFKEFKAKAKYEWIHGIVKDVSPAGFCLAFEQAPSQHTESNELITIKNMKNGQEQYNLGLIRWNRWRSDDIFLIGIELISPQATPIRATLDWDYAKPAYHHNGLLLPDMPNAGIDASIILPPLGYRSGQIVAIMTPEQEYKIELQKKIIETDNFIQFQYQPK